MTSSISKAKKNLKKTPLFWRHSEIVYLKNGASENRALQVWATQKKESVGFAVGGDSDPAEQNRQHNIVSENVFVYILRFWLSNSKQSIITMEKPTEALLFL